MELEDEFSSLGLFEDEPELTLLIDGDILLYRPCCIHTDDDERSKELIAGNIKKKISDLCEAAGASSYILYLTTSLNFRNWLTDDYKANRVDVEKPVNLKWAKMFAVRELGAEYYEYLEADDLLAMGQKKGTIIWSLDKDLMQVPGLHLEETTGPIGKDGKPTKVFNIIEVDEIGTLAKKGKKYVFSGFKGLMYQALVGDTADYIIGCGIRKPHTYKSGAKAGQSYMKRIGIGAAKAYQLLSMADNAGKGTKEGYLELVISCYKGIFGDTWQEELEKQVNLLYMVEERVGDLITQWTYDGRKSLMNIRTGGIICDSDKTS